MNESLRTGPIEITATSRFSAEQSRIERGEYLFVYHIRIRNLGDHQVQLLSRHWIITDALGRVEEVKGSGVIGVQPEIQPGAEFEYESFCPLPTPTGSMQGRYLMVQPGGERFEAIIPTLFLVEPSRFH